MNRATGTEPCSSEKLLARRLRARRSHNVEVPSPELAAKYRPSGENEMGSMAPPATWIGGQAGEPSPTFQSTTFPSSVPATSRRPSAEKAMDVA